MDVRCPIRTQRWSVEAHVTGRPGWNRLTRAWIDDCPAAQRIRHEASEEEGGMEYLNRDRLEQISDKAFQSQAPYPWVSIDQILHPDAHEALRLTLPAVELFDRKVGVKRAYGQGYHDRYILHYRP